MDVQLEAEVAENNADVQTVTCAPISHGDSSQIVLAPIDEIGKEV